MSRKSFYSQETIDKIKELREKEGLTYKEIGEKLELTANQVSGLYSRHADASHEVDTLQKLRRKQKTSSFNARTSRQVLDFLNVKDDILTEIEELLSDFSFPTLEKRPKVRKSTKKKNYTMEILLSDLHIGKRNSQYDSEVAKNRLEQLKKAAIENVEAAQKLYNVEKIIIASLGDLIESATMHAVESTRGVEFGNSKQVVRATELMLQEILLPIASLNVPIEFIGVPGNHDRSEAKRTYHNPGEECLSYIAYKMLEMLVKEMKIKNITFQIPKGLSAHTKIYGATALYEHGDELKGLSRNSLERRRNMLQQQLGEIISFYRAGHYHEFMMIGRGEFIINESICGPDSYSTAKGFTSHSGQTIVEYIETDKRPTPFFRAFPVFLN